MPTRHRYGFLFVLIAIGCFLCAAAGGWPALLWAWGGVSFSVAGFAYLAERPGLFGKYKNGAMSPVRTIVLLPFFALTHTIWHLQRWFGREDASNEVAPGIWVGRRPLAGDVPPGVTMVVDLTAEFPRARGCELPYRCLPTLDASAPGLEAFRALVDEIARAPGGVLIHCAVGHGRSAMLAAAVLMRRGLAKSAAEAEAMLRARRPRIGLNAAQRSLLERAMAHEGVGE